MDSSVVERCIHIADAGGSNPSPSTNEINFKTNILAFWGTGFGENNWFFLYHLFGQILGGGGFWTLFRSASLLFTFCGFCRFWFQQIFDKRDCQGQYKNCGGFFKYLNFAPDNNFFTFCRVFTGTLYF